LFTVCNPLFTSAPPPLGEAPAPCPGELPAGARIHSCEQNPWETAHVLSNGDVVPCEVHDRQPLGNLARQPLAEIWHGEDYRRFRESYRRADLAACRSCPWKTAHMPAPMRNEILPARGRSAQMAHGWHEPDGEAHVWASQQAVASIEPRPGSRTLHVNGLLPPGMDGQANELNVWCNELHVGAITNTAAGMLPFGVDLPIPAAANGPWQIEFRTRFVYRPKERGTGPDQRDLGFALRLLASQAAVDPALARSRRPALLRLLNTVRHIDRLGRMMSPAFRARPAQEHRFAPGLSVVIPERENPGELALCLAGLRAAARRWDEPMETLVVVNGGAAAGYRELRATYPEARWQFHAQPLGFGGAIAAGIRSVHYDWVYLLNSDVVLEEDALAASGRHRDASVFSIASQIVLKDLTRFRDETNWTALFIEDGLATTHDLIPRSARTVEHFYAGGGASLFQTRLLRRVMDPAAYHPFYWEDVEWGWRARKLGRRSLFCGDSVARHTQRATISRFFAPAEIEAVVQRNRLLFQLRNFTTVGSLDAVAEAIARARPEVGEGLLDWRALGVVARGRLWNHAAPVSDEEVLAVMQSAT
jgi:radical SAM protein with 4Fe4S-binding SPASM domain